MPVSMQVLFIIAMTTGCVPAAHVTPIFHFASLMQPRKENYILELVFIFSHPICTWVFLSLSTCTCIFIYWIHAYLFTLVVLLPWCLFLIQTTTTFTLCMNKSSSLKQESQKQQGNSKCNTGTTKAIKKSIYFHILIYFILFFFVFVFIYLLLFFFCIFLILVRENFIDTTPVAPYCSATWAITYETSTTLM